MGPLTTFLIFVSNDKYIGMDVSVPLTGFVQLANMPTGREREEINQNLILTQLSQAFFCQSYFVLTYFSSCFFWEFQKPLILLLKFCDLSLKPLVRLVYNLAPCSKQGKTTLININLTLKTALLSMHILY